MRGGKRDNSGRKMTKNLKFTTALYQQACKKYKEVFHKDFKAEIPKKNPDGLVSEDPVLCYHKVAKRAACSDYYAPSKHCKRCRHEREKENTKLIIKLLPKNSLESTSHTETVSHPA
ncbi:hypothetical protein TetV_100 [Tetraselmis virus 1]|uniref:Uncharacterized protein n=1 Tax=Tetraselmis virus 1 TaxID=2060617 RepID=A0A2P0VMR9_9VIRU|nr:hypothetical protein QJ968_gp100 [Tetraselmis virus 1]AUF82192.1 hypothetical protein TetV_100 [Tetraselmis virus 1]